MDKKEVKIFNIITLGDSGVGKTSIINRYVKNKFDENISSSLGMNFSLKELNFNNKEKIILKLVDTAGQEKYRALAKSYFRNVQEVLYVFSMNDKETFDTIKYWMELFKDNNNREDIPKYLVGTKNDLEIKVEQSLIDEFVKEKDMQFISTSAKANTCIDKLFEDIGKKLFIDYISKGEKKQININISFKAQKKSGCCLNRIDLR